MRRHSPGGIATLIVTLTLVGSSLGGLQSCAEAKAVAATSRIDQIRLGFGLDPQGAVSPGCTSSKFGLRDPIHLSMQITGAPAGSVIRVSVRNTATQLVAWSEQRAVPEGRSSLTFEIGRELAEGRYRAESTLGSETTSPRDFLVHTWGGGSSVQ